MKVMMAASAFMLAMLSMVAGMWFAVEANRHVPAIYVFGDSTADVGNNNHLPGDPYSTNKANYPHNGIDYPFAIPTGRFCNGYVGVDFIAMRMGFERSPPAALSGLTTAEESRGVSYASGGSGILDQTGQNVSISLNTQIRLFRGTVRRLEKARGAAQAHLHLSKSIFIFTTVNNDLFGFYTNSITGRDNTSQHQFISSITTQFKQQLETLYSMGARKMVVFGAGRVGCPPALRRLSPNGGCLEPLNDLSQKFNVAMKGKMISLSSKLKGLKYSYVNSYEIGAEMSDKALQFGFKVTDSACCGSGSLNAESHCTPNATYCSNRDEYLSWDWVHPSQAAYKKIVDLTFDGSTRFVEPISLHDLVRS